jgi:adenylosuccinate synthase
MGKNVVVIGLQWGDEGKGKIVDLLTDRRRRWPASRVATTPGTRWSSAAEDRSVADSLRHPAPGVQCLIGNGVVLSLEALFKEAEMLIDQGVPVFERLRISRCVR